MDYIISLEDGRYFCGWDTLTGGMKFISNRALAYRMRRPIANNTLVKVLGCTHMNCKIEHLEN